MSKAVTRQSVCHGEIVAYNDTAGNFVFARIVGIRDDGDGKIGLWLNQGRKNSILIAVLKLREMKARIITDDELFRQINSLGRNFIDIPDPSAKRNK